MRILIVDDEPRVLDGMVRSLFHLDWDIETAESGAAALAVLEQHPFEVVISDMRMPGMDGAELLRQVKQKYPEVLRIVLSGHTEIEAAMRAVPVAHQFLSKPCRAEEVQEVLDRALSLASYLKQDELRALVGSLSELPSVPDTYLRLREATSLPETSVMDVAAIVEQDTAITAKVLQLVNSSFFSQAHAITTVQQAVVRLGVSMIQSLALATHAFGTMGSQNRELQTFLTEQQDHALKVACAAKALCDNRVLGEQAFLAGLLHDIGKIVLKIGASERWAEVAALQARQGCSQYEAEMRLYGVSHAEVGAYLVGIWGLPYPVVEAIAHHHCPERLGYADGVDVVAALHIAESVVSVLTLSESYLEQAGLLEKMDALRSQVETVIS